MSYSRRISAAMISLVFVPIFASGQEKKIHGHPPAASVPSYVGSPVQPLGSAVPAQKPNPIPVEAPVQMMQFPPLTSYQFQPVQTLRITPASEFVDGSKLYRQNCAECHGHLATSGKRKISFSQVSSAMKKQPRMKKVSTLKKNELHSIVDALR